MIHASIRSGRICFSGYPLPAILPCCDWRNQMIHASIRMKFASENLTEAREILCTMVERTRVSPGCLGCDIYEDLLDSGTLMFEGWWETQDDLDRHLRSALYRHVIVVMEMGIEYPVIKFSEIVKTTGMETLENSRFGFSLGHKTN